MENAGGGEEGEGQFDAAEPAPPAEPQPPPADPQSSDAGSRPDKLRIRIAGTAARMLFESGGDTARARLRAARRVGRGWVPPQHLPGGDEIRREVNRALARESDTSSGVERADPDRFDRIADLVRVLATVRQDPHKHPEGDALEHSLQVFALVREERPYDEELLTAALVHDVGLAVNRAECIAAGLGVLEGLVTERTAWLIEHLPVAQASHEGTLGKRAQQRFEGHPDFVDALLLEEADRKGRVRGFDSPSLEEAVAVLRGLESEGEAEG